LPRPAYGELGFLFGTDPQRRHGEEDRRPDPWATQATFEDPKALHEIREALEARAPFWIEA